MKLENLISVGDKINIEFDTLTCSTVVYDIMDNILVLALPFDDVEMKQGMRLELKVSTAISLYRAEGVVQTIDRGADLPNLIVDVTTQPKKIQRRQNVRIPEKLPVRIVIDREKRRVIAGKLVNLSAGGASLEIDEEVALGTWLELQFYLSGDLDIFDLECEVVRPAKLLRKYPPKYGIGVAFSHLHRIDSERIISYVFEKQRELQRMRRGSA